MPMRKNILAAMIVYFMMLQNAFSCTTFFINSNGQLVFGRNYDWVSDAGIVCTNLKGLSKTSLKMQDGNTTSWVSKYGSITFNQFGKELPTGGMNEKGLVVELMWEDGTKYPVPDDRPAFHVLQWIQYQLDNNATVEGVIATDKKIRIAPNNPPLHYLIADASGNAATIEFYANKMIVHTGKELPFPVLTNSSYDESLKKTAEAKISAGNTNFSFQDNSLERFAKACSMMQQYEQNKINKPVIVYALDMLDNVSQPGFTKWSIVYDIRSKKIYFKTDNYQDIKSLGFDAFNFECTSAAMAINMNQPMQGNINDQFTKFTDELNRSIISKAAEESKENVNIPPDAVEANVVYARNIKCKK
jgi:penicillin V acylase-like amidase (Ntn superfamily)